MKNIDIIREAFMSYKPIIFFYGNTGDLFTTADLTLPEYLIEICNAREWKTEYIDAAFQFQPMEEEEDPLHKPNYKYRQIDESCVNRAEIDKTLRDVEERSKVLIIRIDGLSNANAKEVFLKNLISLKFLSISSKNKLILVGDKHDLEYLHNVESAMEIVCIEKPDNDYLSEYITALLTDLSEAQRYEFIRLSAGRYQREVRSYMDRLQESNYNDVVYQEVIDTMRRDHVCIRHSSITLKDVIGLENAKEEVRRRLMLPFDNEEDFRALDISLTGGCLLYGLPGVGKTYFVEAIANEYNAVFYNLKMSDLLSMWFGETEQRIREIFAAAARQSRAIIFIDEVDAITPNRAGASDTMQRIISQLLIEIQNAGSNVLVIGASNRPWLIDPAFLRSQRFTTKIYVPLPIAENREMLFKKLINGKGKKINYKVLVQATEHFNNADITEVYHEAGMNAIEAKHERGGKVYLTMDDFNKALSKIHSTVSLQDENEMKNRMEECFHIQLSTL